MRIAGGDKAGGILIAALTERWMSSLDYRGAFFDRTVDPADAAFQGPAIFLFWHEYIPILFYLRGYCDITMLLSRHHDAEWLAMAARHMGFETVRGSTTRGGATALMQLMERGRVMNLALTPDGPLGPRRHLAMGAVYLASRIQIPLVPIGLGYDRPYRLSTWDRFAVPRPWSRTRGIVAPRIRVPEGLDRAGLEVYRGYVERVLNQVTDHAERWAASGRRHHGECVIRRQGSARRGITAVHSGPRWADEGLPDAA
ncbi:MAG: DUF374 domain-containing protein [Planctomycetes bacterium]|nr:DUF374 domain-containing protein [Planctomycetota bacterium]